MFCASSLISVVAVAGIADAVFDFDYLWRMAFPIWAIVCGLEIRRLLRSKTGGGSSADDPGK